MRTESEENVDMLLGPKDGAIIFREKGVEIILPHMPDEAFIEKHITMQVALAAKLNDKEFIDGIIKDFYAKVDEHVRNKDK